MASEVSQTLASPVNAISSPMENRPKVDFHPGIWGDMFLNCPDKDIDTTTEQKYEELKEEVRKRIVAPMENSNRKLLLIDVVQRLGVSYHFEKEIEDALEAIYHDSNDIENDLYTTSLRFRLLREHGYYVSCEVFNKFKDEEGHFKSVLTNDVRGLLELYEASYMRVHGEDILDEAISFITTNLTLVAATLDYPLSEQVAHALKHSIQRGLPRIEARQYISMYPDLESPNEALLEFAKIDFNMLQFLHRKELSEICRWWKDLDFTRKLQYIRDRVVECYFWMMGVYFEPQYSLGRKMLTKVIAMASILDDTYDSYGTYNELFVFTNAIERWDIKYMDQLPDYMKIIYKALLDVYEEMKQQLPKERQYRVGYARKQMIQLAKAYFQEAKWTHQNYKPTFGEFRANALLTTGYATLAITAFVGMGDVVTPETFKWASNDPKIIKASTIICRFMDDVAERKRLAVSNVLNRIFHSFSLCRRLRVFCSQDTTYNQKDDDYSTIESYMEEYGASVEEAYDEFNKHIENSWKDINEEFLKPTKMPVPVLSRSLNLARAMEVLYRYGDGYSHVGKGTENSITSLLINPILL